MGWGNGSRTGRKVKPLLSDRIVSRCDKVNTDLEVHTHTHTLTRTLTHTLTHTQKESPNSPAGPVGEHDVAFLVCLLNESYACLFLPVTHGLLKHGPLTA